MKKDLKIEGLSRKIKHEIAQLSFFAIAFNLNILCCMIQHSIYLPLIYHSCECHN